MLSTPLSTADSETKTNKKAPLGSLLIFGKGREYYLYCKYKTTSKGRESIKLRGEEESGNLVSELCFKRSDNSMVILVVVLCSLRGPK